MKVKKRKNRGFTMVELVVVMVIVGILATISVPMYRNYVQRARAQEGYALLGSVASALRVFYVENGTFVGATSGDLGVDAAGNTYFTSYSLDALTGTEFTASTTGTGDASDIQVTVIGGSGRTTELSDNI